MRSLVRVPKQSWKTRKRVISYDAPPVDGEGTLLVDEDSDAAIEAAHADDFRETLRRALHTLDPKDQTVVEMRFGLDGNGERSFAEIGRHFGVCGQRVLQRLRRAFKKLRELDGLAAFVE
jgi:RNA polymerase sigma factor (sigma-70 family)